MKKSMDSIPFKTVIVRYSYHHGNTAKVADAIGGILGAQIFDARNADPEMTEGYELIGLGSGIDSGRHYKELLAFVDRLQKCTNKRAFIFSTSAIFNESKMKQDHSILRKQLQSKGYAVLGEFSCKGFNTNSFLKYFGGMNRGRPNDNDLRQAAEFAHLLKHRMSEVSNDQ
jgi:flavodoxin